MIFIVMITLIIYFVLMAWTWKSLGTIEKNKKIAFILIGCFIMYMVTFIVYQITKIGIEYPNLEVKKSIQHVLVAVFTGLNGIIVMPQIGKLLDKIQEDEIKKEELSKKIILLTIVFTVCILIEVGYMKNTQQGILKIYHAMR